MIMCPECEARRKLAREALMNKAFGKATAHVVKGAAEMIGFKQKTGQTELAETNSRRPVVSKPARRD